MTPLPITPATWPLVSALLDEALALPAAERAAFIDSLSGEQAPLRDTLRALLAQPAGIETDAFLPQLTGAFDRAGSSELTASLTELAPGLHIGPYRLLRELGTGGMGSVWLAERADGTLKRQVALKLPRLAWGRGLAERLARERDILASLEHPHIARLYDAGVDRHGRPYLALEYVEGQPIDAYVAERRLPVRARLDLVQQVAAAVAFAHSRLVIHRDLKPSNILVTADGQVRLLDFGIAKLMEGDRTQETALTQLAGRALTLDYASPEQIAGAPIGTASDVYSVGVVTYQLLTGSTPYRLKRGSAAELEEAIAQADVQRASDAATDPAAKKALRGDLDAILNKALRKDPAQRYPTVDAFAQDLARHLNNEPVSAQPDAFAYRAGKFLRRYRYQSLAVATMLLASAAVSMTLAWQSSRVRAEAQRAEAAQAFLLKLFRANSRDQADPKKAREMPARELLRQGAQQLLADETIAAPVRKRLLAEVGTLMEEMSLHAEAVPVFEGQVRLLRDGGEAEAPELVRALTNLAAALQQTPRAKEGLPALREAEAIVARRGLERSEAAGILYAYLSQQLTDNAPDEAIRYAIRAVEVLRVAKPNSQSLLGALATVANGLRAKDPQTAERYASESLGVAEAVHGADHELTATTAMWLADIQAAVLRFDDARRNFERAEAIAAAKVPPEHYLPMQLDLRHGLLLADIGQTTLAMERLQRAADVALRSRGPDDVFYLPWALGNLSTAKLRAGDVTGAREAAERALALYAKAGKPALAAKYAEGVADVCIVQRDLTCASGHLDQARTFRKQGGTADEPGFRDGLLLRQAQIDLLRGEPASAEAAFASVVRAQMPPVTRFERYRFDAMVGLARVQVAQGRFAEAGATVRPVLDLPGDARRLYAETIAQALDLRRHLHASAGRCAEASADTKALADAWSLIGTQRSPPTAPACAPR